MDYDTYREYQDMFEDIRREVSDSGYATSVVERAKKQVRGIFRNMYATYGRDDDRVDALRRDMDWYL